MKKPRVSSHFILMVSLVALLGASGAVSAEQSGRCYSADISERILLPDGSEHPPGLLKVCMRGNYTPSAGLLTAYVDGYPVGTFVGRVGTTEGSADIEGPVFLFVRHEDGALDLQGYAVDEGERMCTYNMVPGGAKWDSYEVTTRWKLLAADTQPSEDRAPVLVLVAAD